MILTIRLRLRDKHAAELNRQARAVNYVWNYVNEMQRKAVQSGRKWLTAGDLQKLTAGSSKMLDINGHTICKVCQHYDRSRRQNRRPWLRFRGRKSLGWVPFNQGAVAFDGIAFTFRGVRYTSMHIRAIPEGAIIRAGNFNQDAQSRWYINIPIEVREASAAPPAQVGIDLGLKNLATLSIGAQVVVPNFYRTSEAKIGTVQRARKTKRARAIHAKIRNRRRDYLHKASTKLTKEFGLIVIGDVSPSRLSRTSMAKSVNDAGWYSFKRMLSYKSIRNGGNMVEVNERWTSQTCSSCGSQDSPERPRGIAGIGIREWTCGGCGATHDRDVNAARNILRRGLATLAAGAAQMRSSQLAKLEKANG